MTKIKLKEWADKHGLSYLTANRHFHAGMIPGAVQLESGTILVEDESPEQLMAGTTANSDAMSLFLKKTVEFSKNNSTVEDFAAFVISNFQLKLNNATESSPRYSKNRPKPEDVQKHFQQFLPDKESVDHLKAVKTLLKEGKTAGEVTPASDLSPEIAKISEALGKVKPFERVADPTNYPVEDFSLLLSEAAMTNAGQPPQPEGLVSRSVDFNTTPQQINYTGSTSQAFSASGTLTSGAPPVTVANNCYVPTSGGSAYFAGVASAPAFDTFGMIADGGQGVFFNAAGPVAASTPPFQPTQKELLSAAQVIETAETEESPRGKRGRKPTFKKR
jgi:hypothetical protein